MAIEAKRGCGYRQCGGIYLVGGSLGTKCGRLPVPTDRPFTRKLEMATLAEVLEPTKAVPCWMKDCPSTCFMRFRSSTDQMHGFVGFMYVGESDYTPQAFLEEAMAMGVSKRVPGLPSGLVFGKTVVYLAQVHAWDYDRCQVCEVTRKAFEDQGVPCGTPPTALADGEGRPFHQFKGPGIFCAFIPIRAELLVEDDRLDEEWVNEYRDRGVRIIPVPADDKDHGARPKGQEGTVNDGNDYGTARTSGTRRSKSRRRE